MTAARRTRKRYVCLAALIIGLTGLGTVLQASTTERVVVDRYTGLAIYGVDPVAYFIARKPELTGCWLLPQWCATLLSNPR